MNHWELDQNGFIDEFNPRFGDADIQKLCFNLHIDYENLAGDTKEIKAISLFQECKRTERLSDLIHECESARSKVNWRMLLHPSSIDAELAVKRAEIKRLQTQLEQAQEEINKLCTENGTQKAQINGLKQEIKELLGQITDLKEQLDQRNIEIGSLNQTINDLTRQVATLQDVVETFKAQLRKKEGHLRLFRMISIVTLTVILIGGVWLLWRNGRSPHTNTTVASPTGEGIIFDFEDGLLDTDIWSASDDQHGDQTITISDDTAYNGVYSLKFTPHLEERENNGGGNTFCLTLNAEEVTLENRIVISRLFIPEDVPYNLGVQYNLPNNYPSWSNFGREFNLIKPGKWNTFVWYTADSNEWDVGSDLNLCLYLFDRDEANKNKYPEDDQEPASFYLDSVELVPYLYTYISNYFYDPNALKPIHYYAFDNDDIETAFQDLTVLERNFTNVNPKYVFESNGININALRIDLDLPAAGESPPTSNNSAGLIINTNDEPVEAVFTMVLVEDIDNPLMITLQGKPSDEGEPISTTFFVEPGQWTPIFWPVRGNDLDNTAYIAADIKEVDVLITSANAYEGPIYFDYLGVYRFP